VKFLRQLIVQFGSAQDTNLLLMYMNIRFVIVFNYNLFRLIQLLKYMYNLELLIV